MVTSQCKPVVSCCSNRQVQTVQRQFVESVELTTDRLEQRRHATDYNNDISLWHQQTPAINMSAEQYGTPYLFTSTKLKHTLLSEVILRRTTFNQPFLPHSGPHNVPWFSSETVALYKSLTYSTYHVRWLCHCHCHRDIRSHQQSHVTAQMSLNSNMICSCQMTWWT